MISATVERVIPASPDDVFTAVADRANHHQIVPGARGRIVRDGFTQRQGLGTVHRIGIFGRIGVLEQVVEYDESKRFVYRLVRGLPLRNHFGEFDFKPVEDGTHVTMTMRTDPPFPVPIALTERLLTAGLRLFLAGVDRATRHRATTHTR
jgi:uncharacterized protein YndB with AHSA1/START domain